MRSGLIVTWLAIWLALAALTADVGAHVATPNVAADGSRIFRLSAITAEYRASESATYYKATIQRKAAPDSKQIKWSLKPPDDDLTCKAFTPDPLVRPGAGIDEWEVTAVWRHGEGSGCKHENGVQHSGTVTLEVANPNPRQICAATYVGTVNGTQDRGRCKDDCDELDRGLDREATKQSLLRDLIKEAEKRVEEARTQYDKAREKVPALNPINVLPKLLGAEYTAALREVSRALGVLEEAIDALKRLEAKLAESDATSNRLAELKKKICGPSFRYASHSQRAMLCRPESRATGAAAGRAEAYAAVTSAFKRVPIAAGLRAGRQAAATFGRLADKTASTTLARKLRSLQNLTSRGNSSMAKLQSVLRASARNAKTAARAQAAKRAALEACLAAGFGP